MVVISDISELPRMPAVYALYGGEGKSRYVAYVGIATKLKQRIKQHLVRRSSSVVAGKDATMLNPEFVTEINWWEYPKFTEQDDLEAAELVAFDVLQPALRSRGAVTARAQALYDDAGFSDATRKLFAGSPAGKLVLPTLPEAIRRIVALERRIVALETQLAERSTRQTDHAAS